MDELLHVLASSTMKNFLICRNTQRRYRALQHKLSICFLKFSFVPAVVPSSIRLSFASVDFEFITNVCLQEVLLRRSMNRNFSAFDFSDFVVIHFDRVSYHKSILVYIFYMNIRKTLSRKIPTDQTPPW